MRALLILAIVLFVCFTPGQALACTPPPGGLPKLTTADRTRLAPLVLEGTVTAIAGSYPIVATIDVVQYLKGNGPATVTISGFGSSSVCLSEVSAGQRLIFYASGDPNSGLQAFYASQFDAVAQPDPQTIAEILAAAGDPPPQPTVARPATLPNTGGSERLSWQPVALLTILLALWLGFRRISRSSL